MSKLALPKLTQIQSTDALRHLVSQLQNTKLIAIDVESNGLFAYYERVCLIQLSTSKNDYLLDPLKIKDMSPLGELTANPNIEFVFHAAEFDIASLKRDFGFEFALIFDTMMAARILGYQKFGLAPMIDQYFGVKLDKKYQKANWGKRPLSAEQKHYAQLDTHFLPLLHDILYEELKQKNALAEACEIFDQLRKTRPTVHEFEPEGYWYLADANKLRPRQMACLRELYHWRENIARKRDIPRFKVLSDGALVKLAKNRPTSLNELKQKRLLSKKLVERYGKSVLAALDVGAKAEIPTRPKNHSYSRPTRHKYEKLKKWRKNRADERGVESDIIVPGQVLWAIAQKAPKTLDELEAVGELGPWRIAEYGQEILTVLNGE